MTTATITLPPNQSSSQAQFDREFSQSDIATGEEATGREAQRLEFPRRPWRRTGRDRRTSLERFAPCGKQ